MNLVIIIKVNEVPPSREGLKDRVHRAWRINPGRLYNQTELIAVYRGEILEVYNVKGYQQDEEQPDRVKFDLEEKDSPLKGRKIVYRTANPCTIVDPNALELL